MTYYQMERGTVELPANYIFANNWYMVLPNEGGIGYKIVNIKTGIVEGLAEVLPAAVSKSTAWCELMEELVAKESKDESTD